MRAWILVALVACQRSDHVGSVGSGSGTVAPVLATSLVGCAAAGMRPRAGGVVGDGVIGKLETSQPLPSGWFPYARRRETSGPIAEALARGANIALTEKLADLDLCLTGKTGSLSIMLDVATTGTIDARVGGIGDRASELCVARLAKTLALPRPTEPAELECVLSVETAGPFRVTADGGYRVVELTSDAVTLDGKQVDLGTPPPGLDTTLIIAPPDTTGGRLASVLNWVSDASTAVMVAIRADGGPPVFVAMAPDQFRGADHRLMLYIEEQQLHACWRDHRGEASLLEPRKVDGMMREALAACGEACPEIVEVAVAGGKHAAKQLVGATSAVRRAGHDPVLTIGSRCTR